MQITVNGQPFQAGQAVSGATVIVVGGNGTVNASTEPGKVSDMVDIEPVMGNVRVDASLHPLLMHRGMSAGRATRAIADIAERGNGRLIIDETLPNVERGRIVDGAYAFKAQISPGATWTGRELRVEAMQVPDTLLDAMEGRPLGAVMDHPALPAERRILSAVLDGDTLIVTVAADMRKISRRSDPFGAAWGTLTRMIRMRDRTVDAGCGENQFVMAMVFTMTLMVMTSILSMYVLAVKPGMGEKIVVAITFVIGFALTGLMTYLLGGVLTSDKRSVWTREQNTRWQEAVRNAARTSAEAG